MVDVPTPIWPRSQTWPRDRAHIPLCSPHGHNASRADPARGSRKPATVPANPRNDTSAKPCSRGRSPRIPAHLGTTPTLPASHRGACASGSSRRSSGDGRRPPAASLDLPGRALTAQSPPSRPNPGERPPMPPARPGPSRAPTSRAERTGPLRLCAGMVHSAGSTTARSCPDSPQPGSTRIAPRSTHLDVRARAEYVSDGGGSAATCSRSRRPARA